MRHKIENLGGTFLFNSCMTDMKIVNSKLEAIQINNDKWIDTNICVLAIGHSARDTFELLHKLDVNIEQKPFAMGLRIEHLQTWINQAQYGEMHENLEPADYKLVHHADNGRTVYSFCMCPGGYVVASPSEDNMIATNGMSYNDRAAENANSAILVNTKTSDFPDESPLAGVKLQQQLEKLAYKLGGENYFAPIQTVGDFLEGKQTTVLGQVKPSYTPGVTFVNIREHLPSEMGEAIAEALEAFGKKIKYFDHQDAVLTGFETRSSSPVRITRNKEYESNIEGIYPAGEGAGYAGGITSAAVDGIQVAETIASKYSPF